MLSVSTQPKPEPPRHLMSHPIFNSKNQPFNNQSNNHQTLQIFFLLHGTRQSTRNFKYQKIRQLTLDRESQLKWLRTEGKLLSICWPANFSEGKFAELNVYLIHNHINRMTFYLLLEFKALYYPSLEGSIIKYFGLGSKMSHMPVSGGSPHNKSAS